MTPLEFLELKHLVHLTWRMKIAAREEARRLSACEGKHGFPTAQIARQAIHRHTDSCVAPYRCGNCGRWHLGAGRRHPRPELRAW